MCLGTTAVVVEIHPDKGVAMVDYGDGKPREAYIGVDPASLKPGDLVIIHAGVVISTVRTEEVAETMRLLEEAARQLEGDEAGEEVRRLYERLIELSRELAGRV